MELVRLTKLVDKPDDLVRMSKQIRRELRCNHQIGRHVQIGAELDEPPHHRVRRQPVIRPPLPGKTHNLRLKIPGTQLLDKRVSEDLDSTTHERRLRPANRNPHPPTAYEVLPGFTTGGGSSPLESREPP